MKKKIKYILSIIWIIPISILALNKNNYVILDNTKLTKEVIDYINHYSSFIKENKNIDYYVILSNTDKREEEIDKIEKELSQSKNKILLVGIKETNTMKVRVEGEISNIITEELIDEIIDQYSLPKIEKNKWNQAMKNTYTAFYKNIANYYNLEEEMTIEEENIIEKNRFLITLILTGIGIIICLYACSFFKKYQIKRKTLIWIDYLLIIIMVSLNISILVIASEFISSLSLVPIILGEFTAILLYFQDPGKIKEKKKKKKTFKL